ncbi:hypothetical protein OROMI_029012 [Orobanche minor]
MAEVTCSSISTAKLVCKFFLTDYKPSGMKAMAVSYFYCLESIRKTLDGLYKQKRAKLIELRKYTNAAMIFHGELVSHFIRIILDETVKERPIAYEELCRLTKLHAKLRKGHGWCDIVDHRGSGMVRRTKGTSCSGGYDYYNPYI